MNSIKKIPLTFKGELHEIKLINFTIETEELRSLVPEKIQVRKFEGNRALISMVNVKLKRMHLSFMPASCSFSYHHVAFRLLIDDSEFNDGQCKGIFFLKSFTNNPLIVFGGSILTEYRLSSAIISETNDEFLLHNKNNYLRYRLSEAEIRIDSDELKDKVGTIDRAYSLPGNKLHLTIIQREKWPIERIHCTDFKTDFFRTARFEGAFRVKEMIPYTWLPLKPVR